MPPAFNSETSFFQAGDPGFGGIEVMVAGNAIKEAAIGGCQFAQAQPI